MCRGNRLVTQSQAPNIAHRLRSDRQPAQILSPAHLTEWADDLAGGGEYIRTQSIYSLRRDRTPTLAKQP